MESLNKILLKVWEVIKYYDINEVINFLHSIRWSDLLKSPVTWIICALGFSAIVISKRYRYVVFFLSVVAMILLIDKALPSNLENVGFKNFFGFLFGALFIVCLNIYIFFIRD